MKPLAPLQDAFGQKLVDELGGLAAQEFVERDDGLLALPSTWKRYFDAPDGDTRKLLDLARGRVLDIGGGAGSAALYLQEKRLEVTAIDMSPLAVEVMKQRGVGDARVLTIRDATRNELGEFDSIAMLGGNLGLLGSHSRARRLLRRFARMTSPEAVIIGEAMNPYETTDPLHLAYHEQNRQRGRMAGQLRLRIRYGILKTPWFDYLLLSPEELAGIVVHTGWRIAELLRNDDAAYRVVLEKHR